jgi:sulfite reductase alpha subunit-like flavoprotein
VLGQEWLYRDEFEGYEAEGVLQMHTAFSREQATFDGATVGDFCSKGKLKFSK